MGAIVVFVVFVVVLGAVEANVVVAQAAQPEQSVHVHSCDHVFTLLPLSKVLASQDRSHLFAAVVDGVPAVADVGHAPHIRGHSCGKLTILVH